MVGRGRPRGFDREVALRRAMEIFWQHGYEGASMAMLTGAMGINSPSLYATFGSKEELFSATVQLYGEGVGAITGRALRDGATARESIAAMLLGNVAAYTESGHPTGCMVVLAASNYTPANEAIHRNLGDLRRQVREQIQHRLDRGITEGDVPAGTDTAALAAFYSTVLNGLSFNARDGLPATMLRAVAEHALAAWDTLTA